MSNEHSPADVLATMTAGDPVLRAVKATNSSKLSDAEFAKLTAAERLDYCRQFPQHLESGRKT